MNQSETGDSGQVRLQKYMADCGVDSRRHCEAYIEQARVKVNGQTVTKLGTRIVPGVDEVTFDGCPVVKADSHQLVYIMLNKPAGYLVTAKDTHGRKTVFELLRNVPFRVFPVGRLDMDSEGLLILTNDGELAHRLSHPSHEVEKEYYVIVWGEIEEEDIDKLREGVDIEGGFHTHPAKVRVLNSREKNTTCLSVTISEGRKRQVRMMMRAIGHAVKRLVRVREGLLELEGLPSGMYRVLAKDEVERMLRHPDQQEH